MGNLYPLTPPLLKIISTISSDIESFLTPNELVFC
jgi:hypothetical protein